MSIYTHTRNLYYILVVRKKVIYNVCIGTVILVNDIYNLIKKELNSNIDTENFWIDYTNGQIWLIFHA